MARVAVLGCGRTGSEVALALSRCPNLELVLCDTHPGRSMALGSQLSRRGAHIAAAFTPSADEASWRSLAGSGLGVAVLCLPREGHGAAARAMLGCGSPFVSLTDDLSETAELLGLGAEAVDRSVPIVAGAGFVPGLSCLLARHAANLFDEVDEVHVCRAGTGGPACARQHHAALSGTALDWRDGDWARRRSGSGRQLAHFPEPIGPRDCYRAALPDALLLQRAFPEAKRITARLAATRRDRLSAPLPMLRAPHPDGGPGAVRVEVWGRRDGASEVTIYGTTGSPAEIAAAVAATAARWLLDKRWAPGVTALAELADPVPYLAELHRAGVRFATFEGVT
jgi:saccharopine dehydrogenase-like NADP-dependent oxidoreductase